MISRRHLLASLAPSPRTELLIQGAVDGELGPLLEAAGRPAEIRIGAYSFWRGRIGSQNVVLSRTDVGPINAAASTTLGIREFAPRAIVNQGTAGGHNRKLKLYDIVLGERTTDYSAYKAAHADQGAGTDTSLWTPAPHKIRDAQGALREFKSFPGDPRLLAAAERIANPRGRVLRANLGSAFQYNRQLDHIDWLHKTYSTDSEDMESAFSAGAAAAFNTPFLAIRIISDTEWEHPVFERIAGRYLAEFVVALARSL